MCTVTYLPKDKGNYILTSSRDEKTLRPAALAPAEYLLFGKNILFPKDPLAGGTWIAYGEQRTACLLNGGFLKHLPSPPYKKSRGLVLLDYFSFPSCKEFSENYDFTKIEPFTLIIIEAGELFELRWDSEKIHLRQHDSESPRIWSSVTLYTEETIRKRSTWFTTWLSLHSESDLEEIRNFHREAGDGDPENDVLMNRNNLLKTVSISSIEKTTSSFLFLHEDLIHNSFTKKVLEVA